MARERALTGRSAYDADAERVYVGGLERRTENPTVDILDPRRAVLSEQPRNVVKLAKIS